MGAWGLGIFQSDHDYDTVQFLSDEAGLDDLEIKDGKKKGPKPETQAARQADHVRAQRAGEKYKVSMLPKAAAECHDAINYSIYALLCSDVQRVRKHLDSGVLAKIASIFRRVINNDLSAADLKDPLKEGYAFVILGACAMTLGAKLTGADMILLRKIYTKVGLMRDAVTQMEAALDPDTGYVNGVAWDFGTKGVHDTCYDAMPAKADMLCPGTYIPNTASPNGYKPEEWVMVRMMARSEIAKHPISAKDLATTFANLGIKDKNMAKKVIVFPDDVCGGCGAKESSGGGALLTCSKCQKRSYCDKGCQKAHWSEHKKECTAIGASK